MKTNILQLYFENEKKLKHLTATRDELRKQILNMRGRQFSVGDYSAVITTKGTERAAAIKDIEKVLKKLDMIKHRALFVKKGSQTRLTVKKKP